MSRDTKTFLALAALLVAQFALGAVMVSGAGCAAPALPAPPPATPWEPVDPVPTEPAEPTTPPDGGEVVKGMTRADVYGRLGAPTEDPPENPGEADQVRWHVQKDGTLHLVTGVFHAGRLALPLHWAPLVDVR